MTSGTIMDINYQALFTAYLVLLILFGFIAFASLLILFFSIPVLLHPYFYADGIMLLVTGLLQIVCGIVLILIDRRKGCFSKDSTISSLKSVIFPVSLIVFAVMWIGLLVMPHNNFPQLREGLRAEVLRNETNGLLHLGFAAFNCCGVESEYNCSENYIPMVLSDGNGFDGYHCPKGSLKCQKGCMVTIYQQMILPYRPIEMCLGLFGLLLLAVCPLVYAISRLKQYWCPPIVRERSESERAGGDDVVVADDVIPLYPRHPVYNPVLSSLLPKAVQPDDENSHHLVS